MLGSTCLQHTQPQRAQGGAHEGQRVDPRPAQTPGFNFRAHLNKDKVDNELYDDDAADKVPFANPNVAPQFLGNNNSRRNPPLNGNNTGAKQRKPETEIFQWSKYSMITFGAH